MRPFIDKVIEMFPQPYSIKNEIDITSFNECRKMRLKAEPYDEMKAKLEMDFQTLKSELLDPDPNNFLKQRNRNLPQLVSKPYVDFNKTIQVIQITRKSLQRPTNSKVMNDLHISSPSNNRSCNYNTLFGSRTVKCKADRNRLLPILRIKLKKKSRWVYSTANNMQATWYSPTNYKSNIITDSEKIANKIRFHIKAN